MTLTLSFWSHGSWWAKPPSRLIATTCFSSVLLQSFLEQRQETWSLGGGEGQKVGELLWPEQRAQLHLRQEQRLGGGLRWQRAGEGAREGEREGGRGERGGRAAETRLDPLHARWELLLQWPHGPSGTVGTFVLIISSLSLGANCLL